MNFAEVKSIAIPEGNVMKITLGGQVLWEKPASYTNVIRTAQDAFSDQIYNGVGYKNDYRFTLDGGWPSNGQVSVGLIDYIVPTTGLPPTIYIKGDVSLNDVLCQLWKANKTYVTELNGVGMYYTTIKIKEGYYKLVPIENANGRSPLVDNCGVGISYLSFCFYGTGTGLVITLDEPPENLFDIGTDNSDYVMFNGTSSSVVVNADAQYLQANDGSGGYTCIFQNKTFENNGGTYNLSATFDAVNNGYTAAKRFLLRCFDADGNQITSGLSGWTYLAYYSAFYKDVDQVSFALPSGAVSFQIGFMFAVNPSVAGQPVRIDDITLAGGAK